MDGLRRGAPSTRTIADLADASDLRSAITSALTATPISDDGLRRGVWTYVCAERAAGTPPADVIVALTELVSSARFADSTARLATLRRVVMWSVEAYFGHLGGTAVRGSDSDASTTDPVFSTAGG